MMSTRLERSEMVFKLNCHCPSAFGQACWRIDFPLCQYACVIKQMVRRAQTLICSFASDKQLNAKSVDR